MAVSEGRVEFDLVAVEGEILVSGAAWLVMQSLLLELQPAARVRLVGDPPDRIRVLASGDSVDVAPGLLTRVAELAGTPLTVRPVSAPPSAPGAIGRH